MAIANISSPYNRIESLVYDRAIAPTICTAWKTFLNQNQDMIPSLPSSPNILDVGCGGGQISLVMAEHFHSAKIVGIDLSSEQIDRARIRRPANLDRVQYVQASSMDIPWRDRSFDLVYSVASIKHWSDQKQGLSECARVLKPNGILLVLEADPECQPEVAAQLVDQYQFPQIMKPMVRNAFMKKVAGESPKRSEVWQMLAHSQFSELDIKEFPGFPAWLLTAKKRGKNIHN